MILREMLVDDLDQVMEIEEELFSVPWTKEGFLTFLMKENGMFLVVEEKGRILGYCGLLTVLDEGDVTNVAVRRDRQRGGNRKFPYGKYDPSGRRAWDHHDSSGGPGRK